LFVNPTATHAVDEVQDTPARYAVVCPEEIGRFAALHVVPARVSATGVSELPVCPAATHAVAEVQEIPLRWAVVCPEGSGRFAAVHVVPESVSATEVPEPL
jgi:hypothetical protein